MVALIVPKNQLGTAYGLMQSIQNLGLATISLLTGFLGFIQFFMIFIRFNYCFFNLVDKAGYFVLELFFLGSLCSKNSFEIKFKLNFYNFSRSHVRITLVFC